MAKATKDEPLEVLTMEERMMRFQERQLAIQEAALGVQSAQLKQTAPKSNTRGPQISVFNPRGQKDFAMPELKCEMYMPFKMSPTLHALDREEVELFNLITPGDHYEVELTDGAKQHICVIGTRNHATGELEKIVFKGPKDDEGFYSPLFTNDNKQSFPSTKSMLRQMLGDAADDVLTMRDEQSAIKRGELAVSVGA